MNLQHNGFLFDFNQDGTLRVIGHQDDDPKELEIPEKVDGIQVTSIGEEAFEHKGKIHTVVLPNTISRIEKSAFRSTAIEEINFPDSVRFIGERAFDSTKMTRIVLPEHLECIEIMAFYNMFSLKEVVLPLDFSLVLPNAFYISYINPPPTFFDSRGKRIEADELWKPIRKRSSVSRSEPKRSKGFEYSVIDDTCTYVTKYYDKEEHVTVPSELGGYKVVKIERNAFKRNSRIKSIVLPEGLSSIGDKSYLLIMISEQGIFQYCEKLLTVTLPDSLEVIGPNSFQGCKALMQINLPAGLKHLGEGAFWGCDSLHSITIPQQIEHIPDMAFWVCHIMFLKLHDGLLSIGKKAFSSNMLSVIVFPESILSIGDEAFNESSSLTRIALPPHLKIISKECFSQCARLTNIAFPHALIAIEDEAFAWCRSLVEIALPAGLQCLGRGAFKQCTSLKTVYLPESIWHIGEGAFKQCPGVILKVIKGSFAAEWAKMNRVKFEFYTAEDEAYQNLLVSNSYQNVAASYNPTIANVMVYVHPTNSPKEGIVRGKLEVGEKVELRTCYGKNPSYGAIRDVSEKDDEYYIAIISQKGKLLGTTTHISSLACQLGRIIINAATVDSVWTAYDRLTKKNQLEITISVVFEEATDLPEFNIQEILENHKKACNNDKIIKKCAENDEAEEDELIDEPEKRTIDVDLVGTKYDNRPETHERMTVGECVYLKRNPDNIYDKNAIEVFNSLDQSLGHIPREQASEWARGLDEDYLEILKAEVLSCTPLSQCSGRARNPLMTIRVTIIGRFIID